MGQKILILGASGMLGHDLVEAFIDYDLITPSPEELDITNQENLSKFISEVKPAIIINAAAYTDVDGAEKDEALAMKINAEAVGYLAKAAHANSSILVHFSTELVFDGNNENGYKEDTPTNPLNAYGRSKAKGEELLQANHDQFYIIRSCWLYGKAPQKGKPRGLNFVDTMLNLAKDRAEINVVNDQFGKPTFTKDLALATKEVIQSKEPFGIYHLANEEVCSWYDFARKIFEIKKVNVKVNPISSQEYPLPTPRPKYSILINTKLRPMRDWPDALRDYLN